MFYAILIPHQRPASLEIFDGAQAFIRAQIERSDNSVQDFEDAKAFVQHDLHGLMTIDTEYPDFIEDWRIEFNSCCAPQGELRHQGVKVQGLLLEALEYAVRNETLSAGDMAAARSVLVACGRLEAEGIC